MSIRRFIALKHFGFALPCTPRYMLLAERLRNEEEKAAMRLVLEEQVCSEATEAAHPPSWLGDLADVVPLVVG